MTEGEQGIVAWMTLGIPPPVPLDGEPAVLVVAGAPLSSLRAFALEALSSASSLVIDTFYLKDSQSCVILAMVLGQILLAASRQCPQWSKNSFQHPAICTSFIVSPSLTILEDNVDRKVGNCCD